MVVGEILKSTTFVDISFILFFMVDVGPLSRLADEIVCKLVTRTILMQLHKILLQYS